MAIMIHTSTVIVKGHVKGFSGSRISEHQKTGFRDDHIKIIGIYTFTGSGISSFHLNNFGIKHVLINSNPSYFFRNDLWLGEICVGDSMECQYRD